MDTMERLLYLERTLPKGSESYAEASALNLSDTDMGSYLRGHTEDRCIPLITKGSDASPSPLIWTESRPLYAEARMYVFGMDLPLDQIPLYLNSPYSLIREIVRYRLEGGF